MFISPMWDHESERVGLKRCTPVGYQIHGFSDLAGLLGLLALPAVPVWLIYKAINGEFSWSLLWLLPVPFVFGFVGLVMRSITWALAEKRQFHYDPEQCISTWVEDGVRQTYQYGTEDADIAGD